MNDVDSILLLMVGLLAIAFLIVWGLGIFVAVRLARRQQRAVARWALAAVLAGPVLLGAGYLAYSLRRGVLRYLAAQLLAILAVAAAAVFVLPAFMGRSLLIDLAVVLGSVAAALLPTIALGLLGPASRRRPAQPADRPLVEAVKVHKSYALGRRSLHVLRGVSLSVKAGEFVAVLGASGSGKSTLLHVLGLLDSPDRGKVIIEGIDSAALAPAERDRIRCRTIGFVFQLYHLQPELTVLENTMLPAMAATGPLGWARRSNEALARAVELLERLGLGDRLGHRPKELSGGEQQRVAIARALMNRPRILLADEPTGNLDSRSGGQILQLLKELNRDSGQTIIMVTHDESLARAADRIVHLRDGRLK